MLLAYIDEIGETGAFVSRQHPRFNTSPAFGYAGLILPADAARQFGAAFAENKKSLFKVELDRAEHPGRWERKGSSIFRTDTLDRFPHQIRVFNSLVWRVRHLQGSLFYYADEKPAGTPKQTRLDTEARETTAMCEALNRIARYANSQNQNVMVLIDQINEKTRAARLPRMYEHVLGRVATFPEMKRIIEPPMHVDSVLSANIQSPTGSPRASPRAIEYQLIPDSPYEWVASSRQLDAVRGGFTNESKVHLWHRSVDDLHHSTIFKRDRSLFPEASGSLVAAHVDPAVIRSIKAAAERATSRPSTAEREQLQPGRGTR
ncbi:MAG: DUF3800 domain-containing protein [Phycicoccus sp.]